MGEIRAGMPVQRQEQADIPIYVMPGGDTAGARGAAIEALKFHPTAAARSLSTQRTNTIGMIRSELRPQQNRVETEWSALPAGAERWLA